MAFKKRKMAFKRRRFNRRKRSSYGTTSRNLRAANAFQMRSRKMSRSRYRALLYRHTQPFQHYRTIATGTTSIATPNNVTTQSVARLEALTSIVNAEFWKIAGGLLATQFNFNPPVWSTTDAPPPPTIVIRGGRLWCTASLGASGNDVCRVRVQLVFIKDALRNEGDTAASNTFQTWETAALTTVTGTTNISIFDIGDAEQHLYKPVIDKTFDMHSGESMTQYWKIKPVKIDTGLFTKGAGWFPMWYVYVYQLNNSNATAETFTVVVGGNLSFAAMEGNA